MPKPSCSSRLRRSLAAVAALACATSALAQTKPASLDPATRKLAHDVFQQLIETNTTDSVGSVTAAASAMRQRLLSAGFTPADVVLLGPNDRKQNLVARLRARPGSTLAPVLIIGHLDVVEARRDDWSLDPFTFTEKDGYFYGLGVIVLSAILPLVWFKRRGWI